MPKKQATVAIVGAPNVGKSTLLNLWLKEKVSIVSAKKHTTRRQLYGAYHNGDTQLVFVDTPGLVGENDNVWSKHTSRIPMVAALQADYTLLIIDGSRPWSKGTHVLLQGLMESKMPFSIVINKIDLVSHADLLLLVSRIKNSDYSDEIFTISAKSKHQVEAPLAMLESIAKDRSWIDVSGMLQDQPKYGAEIVREKVSAFTKQEVPMHIVTKTTRWEDAQEWRLHVDILVARLGHKKILVGHRGSMVKRIGMEARKELVAKWGRGHLFLNVVVDKNCYSNFYKDSTMS